MSKPEESSITMHKSHNAMSPYHAEKLKRSRSELYFSQSHTSIPMQNKRGIVHTPASQPVPEQRMMKTISTTVNANIKAMMVIETLLSVLSDSATTAAAGDSVARVLAMEFVFTISPISTIARVIRR
jgi:hypothetical protein